MKTPEELQEEAVAKLAETEGKALTPKDRMAIPHQEMPSQMPLERSRNMKEVALGYTAEEARLEAMRCLQCPNAPCMQGCPVKIRIPAFLHAAAQGDFDNAIQIIKESSLLPAVCGRVCPQERQCQQNCTLGKVLKSVDLAVGIGRVERFCADRERELAAQPGAKPTPIAVKPETGKKVAVIGSGPSCITVAADVRREGHDVTMFEALQKTGGVLVYGIPEFRLPKAIVQQEIDNLSRMGVKIETNFVVGRTRTIREMMDEDGFDAVFVGTGAGLPKFMNIPGENFVGVVSANEYLTRANLMRAYDTEHAHTPIYASRKVAVLGGGNVAMDAARMALRLGAEEVHLVYRRTEAEMPARIEEVEHAKEEGVRFHLLQNAVEILGDENDCVTGMKCIRFELGEPDASGRRSPVAIPGSEFVMPVDTVIVAIGNGSNPLISQTTPGLEVNKRGNILVNEQNQTSLEGIYAGGDIVLGAATVILAMGEGRKAAAAINEYLAKR
ncbi:MAG: NADPH-dependent glutamate synthase [Kiritimatiellae bacterium]|nr:NADPH-dependent glutamate synthase [Kiritimatiellia bacterium]